VTLEQNKDGVIQVKAKPQDLVKWLEKPTVTGKTIQTVMTEE